MTNFKDYRIGFLAIVAVALSYFPAPLAWGDGELTTDNSTVPVDELGTGNFSKLPFKVSASVRGGYDDNISTSKTDRQESPFTNASVGITYDFGSPRTQLALQTGGGFTYYWDHPSGFGFSADQEYDVNAYIGLSLEHKASARLTLNVAAYLAYQTEPDFSLALGLNRRNGNYFYTSDKFSATYLWAPRFATTTTYTLGVLNYDDSAVGLFQDHVENVFGNEFKFLLSPTTSLVAEYRFGLVNFNHEGDVIRPAIPAHFAVVNGMLTFVPFIPAATLDRDSTTHYVLAGFDHSFNSRFNVSFRGGAEFRHYEDAQAGFEEDKTSPYFEGTASYALGKTTSVSWTNRYAIEEGDVLLNPTRKTFRTGLSAKHDFTPKISANLGAYYQHDDYDGVNAPSVVTAGFTEESFDAALSLRYAITRYFGVEAGYNHTEVWSDTFLREYTRNRYWGGLNVVF